MKALEVGRNSFRTARYVAGHGKWRFYSIPNMAGARRFGKTMSNRQYIAQKEFRKRHYAGRSIGIFEGLVGKSYPKS
jgi:hypothetical protein